MLPWMHETDIQTIEKYLSRDASMLEYGCGGSTIAFSKFVSVYHSIESDLAWYTKIKPLVGTNTTIHLSPPREPIVRDHDFSKTGTDTCRTWEGLYDCEYMKSWEEYVRVPEKIGKKFDVVLIDGRARPQCARFILDYLNDDAIVFIHDWRRPHYRVAAQRYTIMESTTTKEQLGVLRVARE